MESGWANSLTEAVPCARRSTIDLRLGSARAWKTRSSVARRSTIRLSIPLSSMKVKRRLKYLGSADLLEEAGLPLVAPERTAHVGDQLNDGSHAPERALRMPSNRRALGRKRKPAGSGTVTLKDA